MPIYEYLCLDCREEFESLRPMKDADEPIDCPLCNRGNTSRKITVFYARSGGRVLAGSDVNCSSCSAQGCSSCGR